MNYHCNFIINYLIDFPVRDLFICLVDNFRRGDTENPESREKTSLWVGMPFLHHFCRVDLTILIDLCKVWAGLTLPNIRDS